jgi:diamine N-acetyltransferase
MNEMNTKAGDKISLRQARPEDIPALAAIAGKAFWEAFTGMMPEDDLQAYIEKAFSPEQVLLEWKEPGNVVVMAFFDQECAGYAKVNTKPAPERKDVENYIELERLYLLKRYHGRKIGATLMEYCIRYAREKGFDTLWLNVWEQNTQAIEFYRAWGFTVIDWSIRMRGNDPQKAIWMKRML